MKISYGDFALGSAAATLVIFVLAIVVSARSDTVAAPKSACKAAPTGQRENYIYFTYVCAAFDKNGICTLNMPIENQATRYVYRTVCDWQEWRG